MPSVRGGARNPSGPRGLQQPPSRPEARPMRLQGAFAAELYAGLPHHRAPRT